MACKAFNNRILIGVKIHIIYHNFLRFDYSTALRKGPPATTSSYNVKKSKSYGNFDSVNRDYSFQVCIAANMARFEPSFQHGRAVICTVNAIFLLASNLCAEICVQNCDLTSSQNASIPALTEQRFLCKFAQTLKG